MRHKKIKLLLRDLKAKCGLQEKLALYMENTFPQAMSQIVIKLKCGKRQYTPELRAFALTHNFYSPKAYNFIRNEFQNSLPHPSTLKTWYHEVQVEEGFTDESFKSLKLKCDDYKNNGKQLYCSLMLDEMHLKKLVEWDGKYCHGFSSVGKDSQSSDSGLKVATQVLVLLVVALDSRWKVPIGYFFHRGLNGQETAEIVKEALIRLNKIGM